MAENGSKDSQDLAKDRTDWAEDRTLLANERTFAGWMRTGLAAVGIGLAVEAIFKEAQPTWMAKSVATIFILIGVGIFIAAWRSSVSVLKRLNDHAAEPIGNNRMGMIVAFFAFGSAALAVVLWLI